MSAPRPDLPPARPDAPGRPDLDVPAEPSAEARPKALRTARIAAQNDAFRRAIGPDAAPCGLRGRVALTRTLLARDDGFVRAVLRAVAADETFTENNDPDGDHGFGAVGVEGVTVWWKLDLHDRVLRLAGERPDDPEATAHALTILLPEDW